VTICCKSLHGAKLVKDATKKLFSDKLNNCETLEPVCWSQRGLCWKALLVSFLYIYNKCAPPPFFLKSPFTFDLPSYLHSTVRVYYHV
jgi:hypothetical protein